MSQFDRSENSRRSFRRRKLQAPLPPNVQTENYATYPDEEKADNCDESQAVLKKIQMQINRFEISSSIKTKCLKDVPNTNEFVDESGDLKTNSKIVRSSLRSSTESARNNFEDKEYPRGINKMLERSQSDTKKVDILRKKIKDRELLKKLENEKVKIFMTQSVKIYLKLIR